MNLDIVSVSWDEAAAEHLKSVRFEVFVDEQGVPPDIELDELDHLCDHLLARDSGGQALGCVRLTPAGQIGRMAVRAPFRNRGVGSQLLHAMIAQAKDQGRQAVFLHAQVHAQAFYQRHGFCPVGQTFCEAGIQHQHMTLSL